MFRSTLKVTGKNGKPIDNLADWKLHGVKRRQGKEGRSAYSLAYDWCSDEGIRVPPALQAMLAQRAATAEVQWSTAQIEHTTQLPYSSSGPRHHDLFLKGERPDGTKVALSVEAKADEELDRRLAGRVKSATIDSDFPTRLRWLSMYLLGEDCFSDFPTRQLRPEFSGLYYQPFAALGGLMIEAAEDCSTAVMLFHTYESHSTKPKDIARNDKAISDFLHLLFSSNKLDASPATAGQLHGPIYLPTGAYDNKSFPKSIALYISRLHSNTRPK